MRTSIVSNIHITYIHVYSTIQLYIYICTKMVPCGMCMGSKIMHWVSAGSAENLVCVNATYLQKAFPFRKPFWSCNWPNFSGQTVFLVNSVVIPNFFGSSKKKYAKQGSRCIFAAGIPRAWRCVPRRVAPLAAWEARHSIGDHRAACGTAGVLARCPSRKARAVAQISREGGGQNFSRVRDSSGKVAAAGVWCSRSRLGPLEHSDLNLSPGVSTWESARLALRIPRCIGTCLATRPDVDHCG